MKIQNTAIAAIRYEVSNTAAAAIASGFLKDLVEAKVVPESALFLLLDKNKVHRAKDKVMSECQVFAENRLDSENVSCILFDGRSDKTNLMTFNEETKKFYPLIKKEDHYTLTDEYGRYLHHFTKGEMCEKSKIKPAEHIANQIFKWSILHCVEHSLKFIGCDSTATNTGHNGGVIHCLEIKLERKLGWLICSLHTNELCFRHLVEELDGKTTSKTGFSGPIGKLLFKVTEMERNYSFKPIFVGPGLIELDEEIIKELSSDQKYAYKICQTVISGTLTKDLANQKPGTIVHSRWLNTGSSLLLLWISKHGLEGDVLRNLELIVKFLVSVYFPMWFQIKVKHSWIEGPRHILNQLNLIKLQDKNVQKVIEKYVRSSAWNSHSEILLQTLLCSQNKIEREFAVNKILEIRKYEETGTLAPRTYKLPHLNLCATKLIELITWEEAYESILTCQMNINELKKILDCPMVVPYFPVHTQAVERAVKEVTAASETVFGFERRDGFIRARAENRSIIPRFNSKKDLIKF
ncbi:uncharacterized protein LOC124808427 [Hydra vulgaris]|uniref:uncharacterized protein LOC124808427 n=1 Tax=Hydra vulgaris TaxID=6087 RepID=UPI001F5FC0FB|nr:uncharacterized protein LOC124808427 [Hydra vulgaris]